MKFSEFLREGEELNALSEALANEGLWDVGAGLARTVGGVMGVGDELLARSMGQGTKGRLGRAFGEVGGGLRRAAFGRPAAPTPAQPSPPSATPEQIGVLKSEFDRLKKAYVQAHKTGDADLKRRIRARMLRVDPAAYADLMKRSVEARKERERQRWAFADAPRPESPKDYLGRLGTEH